MIQHNKSRLLERRLLLQYFLGMKGEIISNLFHYTGQISCPIHKALYDIRSKMLFSIFP